jgi:hypothetical protein
MAIFNFYCLLLSISSVLSVLSNKTKDIGESRCRVVSNTTLNDHYTKWTICGSIPLCSESTQLAPQSNDQVCKSKVCCHFDNTRFPPYLYQSTCTDDSDLSNRFQCGNNTYRIWVLRLKPCLNKKVTMYRWVWQQELVYTGCNIRNEKMNVYGALKNAILAVKQACIKGHC